MKRPAISLASSPAALALAALLAKLRAAAHRMAS